MAIELIEHTSTTSFGPLIDEIRRDTNVRWGIAAIKRDYLRPMTNEAFLLAMRPTLQEAAAVNVFFVNPRRIYIVWSGSIRPIYKHLRSFISVTLTPPGSSVKSSAIVSYVDPYNDNDDLDVILSESKKFVPGDASSLSPHNQDEDDMAGINEDDDDEIPVAEGGEAQPSALSATAAQMENFREAKGQKPYRRQLQILVVEDQIFSQKLICEIIRGARTIGNDAPAIDPVVTVSDAWKIFIKKAPDLVFVDLGLPDGSGHALARAIKEIDPMTQVIIVTANNYEEELEVARQNNVDGFIAKPYNKKQILDCIDRYVVGLKGAGKGLTRGTASQLR